MNSLLFSGASGFLGLNVKPLLSRNYKIKTIGITAQDDYNVDIANNIPALDTPFDIVLHAAGKAHIIPKTEDAVQSFYDINYQGTINLCKALEKVGIPKSFIFVSTVAVYGCEVGKNISEESSLNGNTPYAKSKIMAEEYLQNWCEQNNVILSIMRPSLLVGSNAPGNLGTMVKAIKSGKYLCIAGGKARKSMLMVQDIANLVPLLVEKGGIYNVCDNIHPSFKELEISICSQLGKKKIINIPYWVAKILALCGDIVGNRFPINSDKLSKITHSLTFSNEKAKRELAWEPLSVLEHYKI